MTQIDLPYPYLNCLNDIALANGGKIEVEYPRDLDLVIVRFHCSDGVHYTANATRNSVEVGANRIYMQMIDNDYINPLDYLPKFTVISKQEVVRRDVINGQNDGVCQKCGRELHYHRKENNDNAHLDGREVTYQLPDEEEQVFLVCDKCWFTLSALLTNASLANADDVIRSIIIDAYFASGSNYDPIEFA